MRKHIIAVICAVLTAVGAAATTLDITTTDFTPGGEIKSSSFLTMASEIETWANGNVGTDNIPDSGITSAMLGANSVNATHLATSSVRARHIDTGAIYSDTQFATGWTLPTARFVSSTDTRNNFTKMISGYYYGDGTDTRTIWNTASPSGHIGNGVAIPFTTTRVEIYSTAGVGVGSVDGCNFIAVDTLQDSYVFAFGTDGGGIERWGAVPVSTSGLTWGPGTYPVFVNNSDSHGFRVRHSGATGANTANVAGELYMFTVWGY